MFAEVLKLLRQEKGFSQRELAKELNISHSTLGMYEVGKREPDHNTLRRIADYFDVSLDYLLGRSGERNEHPVTQAAHRADDGDEDLPPEAIERIEELKALYRLKYKKK